MSADVGEVIRGPVMRLEQLIGGLMIGELFGARVPIKKRAGVKGYIRQQRGGSAAVSGFDVAMGGVTALDAIQKISRVGCGI